MNLDDWHYSRTEGLKRADAVIGVATDDQKLDAQAERVASFVFALEAENELPEN
jgi:hypothetical protein